LLARGLAWHDPCKCQGVLASTLLLAVPSCWLLSQ
jgi:hypothetical protein